MMSGILFAFVCFLLFAYLKHLYWNLRFYSELMPFTILPLRLLACQPKNALIIKSLNVAYCKSLGFRLSACWVNARSVQCGLLWAANKTGHPAELCKITLTRKGSTISKAKSTKMHLLLSQRELIINLFLVYWASKNASLHFLCASWAGASQQDIFEHGQRRDKTMRSRLNYL